MFGAGSRKRPIPDFPRLNSLIERSAARDYEYTVGPSLVATRSASDCLGFAILRDCISLHRERTWWAGFESRQALAAVAQVYGKFLTPRL